MIIAICGSLNFTEDMKIIADKLRADGHEIYLPATSEEIINDQTSLEDIVKQKEDGTIFNRMIRNDVIKVHYEKIKKSDCILVINPDKRGIANYIGGNTLLEMGFAHVLNKKIFLLNNIPELSYTEEIKAMQPNIINGELSKLI